MINPAERLRYCLQIGIPKSLCDAAEEAMDTVLANASEHVLSAAKTRCNTVGIDRLMTFLSLSRGDSFLVLEVQCGVTLARTLSVRISDAEAMYLTLSPSGSIISGEASFHRLVEPVADKVVRTQTIEFSDNYRSVNRACSRDDLFQVDIDRARAAVAAVGAGPCPNAAPASCEQDFSRALLIDSKIHVDLLASNAALYFDSRIPAMHEADDKIPDSSTEAARTLAEALPFLVLSEDDIHGTQMASVLADGQDDQSVSFLPLSTLRWFSRPAEFFQTIADKIVREKVRVVVLAHGLSCMLSDNCEEVWGSIFSAFESTVLFVFSAGNVAMPAPRNSCPHDIAGDHPNVVIVTNSEADGTLSRWCTYGPSVHLATYGEATLRTKDSYDRREPHLTRRSAGTSIAAANVGRTALKFVRKHPGSTPEALIGLMMRSCRQDGLPVACGGSLDLQQFESRYTR